MKISPARLEQIIGRIDYIEGDETFYFSKNSIMISKGDIAVEGKPESIELEEDRITIVTDGRVKIVIYPNDETTRVVAELKKNDTIYAMATMTFETAVIDPYDVKGAFETIEGMLKIV